MTRPIPATFTCLLLLVSCDATTPASPDDATSPSLDAGVSDAGAPDAGALDAGASDAGVPDAGASAPVDVRGFAAVVTFSLNLQEFTHRAEMRATLSAVLDLHEAEGVPIDVYFTDTVLAVLEDDDPALLARVLGSPVVTLGYHVRPPKPYSASGDWTGELIDLASSDPAALRARIEDYESHLVDLELGTPTARAGGFAHLSALAGSPPVVVGAFTDPALRPALWGVFESLGATFFVRHGARGRVAIGDALDGHWLRPEDVDLRLIDVFEPAHAAGGCDQVWSADPEALLDDALAGGCAGAADAPPCVVAVKMHDNDFFACDSAWATVYTRRDLSAGPPFPIDRASSLLSAERRARRSAFYAGIVRHAATLHPSIPTVSVADLARALPGAG